MVTDAATNTVDSTDNLTPRKTFYPALPEKAELSAFTAACISTSSKLANCLVGGPVGGARESKIFRMARDQEGH